MCKLKLIGCLLLLHALLELCRLFLLCIQYMLKLLMLDVLLLWTIHENLLVSWVLTMDQLVLWGLIINVIRTQVMILLLLLLLHLLTHIPSLKAIFQWREHLLPITLNDWVASCPIVHIESLIYNSIWVQNRSLAMYLQKHLLIGFRAWGGQGLSRALRIHKLLLEFLISFSPDILLLRDLRRYLI